MDSYLVDYLSSSKAWVLVGSGLSIERGYPSWEELALITTRLVSTERPGETFSDLTQAFNRKDYPKVFEEAQDILGVQRLIQNLNNVLKPNTNAKNIYDLLAQWPVPVYLTTNFDDEIQKSLAAAREAYISYNNSEDHLRSLNQETRGAIFKLHGDLRSEAGLILTSSQYHAIENAPEWEYWRTKMTSVFQMQKVVIIGYSLSDPHIKHILERAQRGASFEQPICWLAPDVTLEQSKNYLEGFNIRVIPYSNRDGKHKNLLRLLETISDFVPKRLTISIRQQVKNQIKDNYEDNSAAPGYFVFNTLLSTSDFEEKRVSVMVSAIQSILPKLQSLGQFSIQEALTVAGWPESLTIPADFESNIARQILQENILLSVGEKYIVNPGASEVTKEKWAIFQQLRGRFIKSLTLRVRSKFPSIGEDAEMIANDIEASLITYFKEGGLTLASTLFSREKISTNIPPSIIKIIQEASSRYDDILLRQAFFTISIDAFVQAKEAEREYLGRIAQGFFGFHALGAFGNAARERLQTATNTVWLLDSNLQIHTLALASSLNFVFRESFSRLHELGIRLFTTEKLFSEVVNHLLFANHIIKENGVESYYVIAAARGEAPYVKSNTFLDGFIRWQSVSSSPDWETYLFQIFGESGVCKDTFFTQKDFDAIRNALLKLGIEVVDLEYWPGYRKQDEIDVLGYKERIVSRLLQIAGITSDYDQLADPDKKAAPEAEVLQIINKEREGKYFILRGIEEPSDAWFISDTSMLNAIENGLRITWQPEAYLRFTSTLFPAVASESSDQAFEILLTELAKSGINLLDEKVIESVFSKLIDQAELNVSQQRSVYKQLVGDKYSDDPVHVMSRIAPIHRPLAAVQLANEVSRSAIERQQHADNYVERTRLELEKAKQKLAKVEKYRTKIQKREFENKRRKRKNKARRIK